MKHCILVLAIGLIAYPALAENPALPTVSGKTEMSTIRQKGDQPAKEKKNEGKKKQPVRQKLLSTIEPLADVRFEKIDTDKNLLRGFVTFSVSNTNYGERPYIAYVYLNWGDLDKLIPNISSNFYKNWDGHVKVQEAAYATVIQEFAFDSGTTEPRIGSGRDKLLKDETSSQVRWLAAVVGATDGLLIKLEMHKPEARGEIKAGPYMIPFEIRPGS